MFFENLRLFCSFVMQLVNKIATFVSFARVQCCVSIVMHD